VFVLSVIPHACYEAVMRKPHFVWSEVMAPSSPNNARPCQMHCLLRQTN